jgi:hypothetical protein
MNSEFGPLIEKAEGVTASERYLHQLCERSFLSLWTYPGIYRDQGKQTATQEGKEVCDLVVVFGDHVILFSDKEDSVSESGKPQVDWKRWYRKAVEKSASQLWGAERWFRDFQERLFLDRACHRPFPIQLPVPSRIKFHRIAVARGATERCRKFYGGGSGTLPFYAGWLVRALMEQGKEVPPFVITDVDPARGFVHVFDDIALDIVISTLDTPQDFVNYLIRRERFLRSRLIQSTTGEEELLAFYMHSWSPDGDLDFSVPQVGAVGPYSMPRSVILAEGGWAELISSPTWRALQVWREVSYFWDNFIEFFTQHAMMGTLYKVDDPSLRHQETLLRFLASEPRYRRRELSAALLGQIARAATNQVLDRSARIMLPPDVDHPVYLFVVVGSDHGEPEDQYRERRRVLLKMYCIAARHLNSDYKHFVGIGFEPRDVDDGDRTYDLVYLDATVWTKEMAEHAAHVQRELGLLEHLRMRDTGREPRNYPDARSQFEMGMEIAGMKLKRNEICPCGSGRKYKRCHGKA